MPDLNPSILTVRSLVVTVPNMPFSGFSVACKMQEMWAVLSQVTEEVKAIRLWRWMLAHPLVYFHHTIQKEGNEEEKVMKAARSLCGLIKSLLMLLSE